ncbi:MAG: hypothetical protein AAGC95_06055 [Pseudomonadota bacterium]
MGILKIIGGLVVLVVVAVVSFFAFLGGFKTVTVDKGAFGPAEIVFTTHKGPYENLSESWTVFMEDMQAAGFETCDSLAVYLDRPGTPPEDLRSIIACRIDGMTDADKATLRAAFANMTLPGSEALTSRFPFKNMASYFIAPMKVYPEFEKRLAADASATPHIAIEYYGDPETAREIAFFMPLNVDAAAYQPLFDAF